MWYLTFHIDLSNAGLNTGSACTVIFSTDAETLWSYNYLTSTTVGTIYGSGALSVAATEFLVQTSCTGDDDVSIGYDDIGWSVYSPSLGLNPLSRRRRRFR